MHVSEASMLPVKIVYVGICRYGKLSGLQQVLAAGDSKLPTREVCMYRTRRLSSYTPFIQ